jgi:hypothetical protein
VTAQDARKAYVAKWHAANRERVRAHKAAYYERNRQEAIERACRYNRDNPEKNRAAGAKWREQNKDVTRAKSQRWAAANGHKIRASVIARRQARRVATPAWADRLLMADIYRYARIVRDAGIDCHVDHVLPLRGRAVSGLHVPDNLTVLLAEHNLRKGNRYDAV